MLFNSFTFLCFFLPIVLTGFYIIPYRFRNIFLLAVSLLFYMWGEPTYIFLMIIVILITYRIGILIDNAQSLFCKRLLAGVGIVLFICVLFLFKYMDFTILTVNNLINTKLPLLHLLLPIGISFYIFQSISYIADVSRGKSPVQKNPISLALYISLFPQLMAGPIIRYNYIHSQLKNRRQNLLKVYRGFRRFLIGLIKKVLIANPLGVVVNRIYDEPIQNLSPIIVWIAACFFMLQIYFDFSGYSDMAIGLGKMFGFRFPENFRYPYRSKSVTEFWRRWHITLSSWFKDYIYIPLGGNRKGLCFTILNLIIVFLLTGLWHGASWTFVAWGLWNAFFIIMEKMIFLILPPAIKKRYNWVGHIYLLLVVGFGFILFRCENISDVSNYYKIMFEVIYDTSIVTLPYYVKGYDWVIALIGLAASFGIFRRLLLSRNTVIEICINLILWVLAAVVLLMMTVSGYQPFIYFRF